VTAAGGLLANGYDIEGSPISITEFTVNGILYPVTANAPGVADIAGIGKLTIHIDGSYRYEPVAGYTGPIPVATYVISDGNGGFDSSVIEENNAALSAFYANSDNPIFNSGGRKEKYETPRFMNTSLLIPGNASSMTNTSGVLGTPSGTALKLNGTDLNIDRYSPEDEIRIAFSVVDKPINSSQLDLGSVRIKIEFRYSSEETSPKAEFDAVVQNENSAGLEDSRYFVSSKAIKDMTYSTTDFSWASVSVVHIYVAAYSTASNTISSSSSSDFYVALDGLRIENAQTNNPLYGMIGYSVLKNKDAETIIKKNNSTSYIEFRYALDVN
jgi:hypothetical protein